MRFGPFLVVRLMRLVRGRLLLPVVAANLSTESGGRPLLVVSANLPWRIRGGIVSMPRMTRRYSV